ncbi:Golgi transport complex subunit 4 [Sporothrix bragantina]|uniref:Conserved oligomeric Golgi complex subunit 4 n=1 Tax=Sporothrix bragantina TaxID=671064 RepID=A0ABP0B698_9PEZI
MKNTSDGSSGTPGTAPGSVPGGRSRSGSSAAHQRRISVSRRTGDASTQNGDNSSSTTSTSALEAATTTADIRAALAGLHTQEDELALSLQKYMGQNAELSRDLMRLDSLRATLGAEVINTRGIATTMLAGAAETAARLSSTVRSLDLEKERIEKTLAVVEQVKELKSCVAGVVGSMGAPQDWEAAANYLARASLIPADIIASGFANAVVPTVEVPDPPAETLEAARESLCRLFLSEFERAAKENDDANVTRFFKLFPLIGRADVGLDVYGRKVCLILAESARTVFREAPPKKDHFFYANALAKLFVQITKIVEDHGTLVERHYGGGQMIKVIGRLQKEADVQGGIIVDAWSDERGIDRKLTDVKSYPFSFLVQSFLAMQRGPSGLNSSTGGGSGMGTPGQDGTSRVNSPALGIDGGMGSPRQSEDEGNVNLHEVDGLLKEISMMLSRWSMYSRTLAYKCRAEEAAAQERGAADAEKDQKDKDDAAAAAASPPQAESDRPLVLPDVLVQSNLQRKVAARLVSPYNLLSTFFFRRSVEKAFQLEETIMADLSLNMNVQLDSNPPYILSAVDDVMFIVRAVIQNCMKTMQKDVVVGVIPPVSRVLSADYIGMIQRKMRDEAYPRPLVNGGFPPQDRVIAFIVLINSLDMSMEYLARIVTGQLRETKDDDESLELSNSKESRVRIPNATAPDVVAYLHSTFSPFEHDGTAVVTALSNLFTEFSTKASDLQHEGVSVLFNQVVKLRLRPIMSETFRDVDYTLDEQELAEFAEANDEDVQFVLESVGLRFEHGWNALMRPLARIMTPRTFAQLADMTARHLARILEKRVWTQVSSSSSGHNNGRRTSAYGAIRMERDMNSIVGAIARGSSNYGARELFAKTLQILTVANMEDDEWEELGGDIDGDGDGDGDGDDDDDDGMIWHLTEDERRRARGMVRRQG